MSEGCVFFWMIGSKEGTKISAFRVDKNEMGFDVQVLEVFRYGSNEMVLLYLGIIAIPIYNAT